MRCGKKLSFILLLFFLASVLCFSLSDEEKAILPDLSQARLISIILEYDEGLTLVENVLEKLKISTTREKEILKTDLEESIIREAESLNSLEMAKRRANKAYLFGGATIVSSVILFIYFASHDTSP